MKIAKFTAAAAAFPLPITWQWQISDGSSGWSDIVNDDVYSGAQSTALKVKVSSLAQDGGFFRAVARNSFGEAISEAALLTVTSGSGL